MDTKFPKPTFDAMLANYSLDPESVHDCRFIHTKNPVNVNTCAIRMGEALALANGLVESREAITALTNKGGDGRAFLFGLHEYPALLCPHGISRGAGDVAAFLRRQWGEPDKTWTAQDSDGCIPDDARGLQGLVAFVGIPNLKVQGHIDLWNGDDAVGHQFWSSKHIYLWVLKGSGGSAHVARERKAGASGGKGGLDLGLGGYEAAIFGSLEKDVEASDHLLAEGVVADDPTEEACGAGNEDAEK